MNYDIHPNSPGSSNTRLSSVSSRIHQPHSKNMEMGKNFPDVQAEGMIK